MRSSVFLIESLSITGQKFSSSLKNDKDRLRKGNLPWRHVVATRRGDKSDLVYRLGDKLRGTLLRQMASRVLEKFVKIFFSPTNLFRRKKFKKLNLNLFAVIHVAMATTKILRLT